MRIPPVFEMRMGLFLLGEVVACFLSLSPVLPIPTIILAIVLRPPPFVSESASTFYVLTMLFRSCFEDIRQVVIQPIVVMRFRYAAEGWTINSAVTSQAHDMVLQDTIRYDTCGRYDTRYPTHTTP